MITSRIARRASSSPPIAYTQPPSARYTKLLRNWSLRICFCPSSSARRLDVTGASSVSPTSASAATTAAALADVGRSEEHTSELQSHVNLVCRLLLEKKKKINDSQFLSIMQSLTLLLHD